MCVDDRPLKVRFHRKCQMSHMRQLTFNVRCICMKECEVGHGYRSVFRDIYDSLISISTEVTKMPYGIIMFYDQRHDIIKLRGNIQHIRY
jgi:hypothetical protein